MLTCLLSCRKNKDTFACYSPGSFRFYSDFFLDKHSSWMFLKLLCVCLLVYCRFNYIPLLYYNFIDFVYDSKNERIFTRHLLKMPLAAPITVHPAGRFRFLQWHLPGKVWVRSQTPSVILPHLLPARNAAPRYVWCPSASVPHFHNVTY